MSNIIRILSTLFLVAYPVVVYIGFKTMNATLVAALLGGFFLLRLGAGKSRPDSFESYGRLLALIGLVLVAIAWLSESPVSMQYYPVAVNILLGVVFGQSLVYPPPLAERLARLKRPDLPEYAVIYTRRVTMMWCAFFFLNAGIAWLTVLHGSMEIWSLYNGLIGYIMVGALMIGERIFRTYVRGQWR